ncbi:MAG: hypothetical protein NZL83_04345 [Candidatus Absconditabacterales bacterium]|nr:hypothetical protein [Candidatus Absconditabacterales bacterium]
MGYSDITSYALYIKTGKKTYHGPVLLDFATEKIAYTQEWREFWFGNTFYKKKKLLPSQEYSYDARWTGGFDTLGGMKWYPNTDGHVVLRPGKGSGRLVGGNLISFAQLFGTEYMPSLMGSIVLVEDVDETPTSIWRVLQTLFLQPGVDHIQEMLIGRWDRNTTQISFHQM